MQYYAVYTHSLRTYNNEQMMNDVYTTSYMHYPFKFICSRPHAFSGRGCNGGQYDMAVEVGLPITFTGMPRKNT